MARGARVVRLAGRAPLPGGIRQWMGDSRGRWDGDTLVVESRNYTDKTGSFYTIIGSFGSGETLHLVERFTRIDAETLGQLGRFWDRSDVDTGHPHAAHLLQTRQDLSGPCARSDDSDPGVVVGVHD